MKGFRESPGSYSTVGDPNLGIRGSTFDRKKLDCVNMYVTSIGGRLLKTTTGVSVRETGENRNG